MFLDVFIMCFTYSYNPYTKKTVGFVLKKIKNSISRFELTSDLRSNNLIMKLVIDIHKRGVRVMVWDVTERSDGDIYIHTYK